MKYWGYLHSNGTRHLRRYFTMLDLEDAEVSPYVQVWTTPFDAESREDALRILNDKLDALILHEKVE